MNDGASTSPSSPALDSPALDSLGSASVESTFDSGPSPSDSSASDSTAPSTERVLEFANVGKTFGKTEALRGVSLSVHSGEIFGLLGPNGAGKTTLIRIGLDILRPDHGTVTLFGSPLHRDTLDRVAYLPEERGLYKKTKVVDALVYFGRLKGLTRRAAKAATAHWLDKVGMSHVARQNVETLSKGMSQKVQLAATLLSEPELCVLDEPFSGLDPLNVDLVKRLIQERRNKGQTTILSTHMMSQVEALCDRVALIHAGERVIYGPLNEVIVPAVTRVLPR